MTDELLDVVNDDDIVTAREMRSVVHRLGLQHRGVHIFLVTPEAKLLVQQRSRHKETLPLALDCSVSEHLKAGEGYREAAGRGLAEELGIHGIRIHPLVKFKMNYAPNDNEICQLYKGRVDPVLVQFDPLEVEGITYRSLKELETLIRSGKVAFCDWFVQLLSWYMDRPSKMEVMKIYSRNRLLFPMGNGRR
jgi:isopentenyldiphosphate isomerase